MTELTTTRNKLHTPLALTPVACGQVYETGWIAPTTLTYDEWATQGAAFQTMSKLLPYAIGDWLNAGEQAFGEMYTQAIEWTGSDRETLEQYKWVTSRIPPERRYPPGTGISFTHLRLVARLPPDQADAWLSAAFKHGWSSRQLAEEMRQHDQPQTNIIPAKLTKQATPEEGAAWLTATFDSHWIEQLLIELGESR